MNYTIPMPSLGADMETGKLMDWKIKPGDHVKKGQVIAAVETSKSVVEIESFREGTVIELVGKLGEQIQVGQPIAKLEVIGTDLAPDEPAQRVSHIKISPAARKLAQEHNLKIDMMVGSGAEGQIELKDVEASLLNMRSDKPTTSGVNLRSAIAKIMTHSKKEIPHYYLKTQVSLDNFMNWIDKKNQNQPPEQRLLIPAVLCKAIIASLNENPLMNGYYNNDTFEPLSTINLGVAVALKTGGVLVPAIIDSQKMTLSELNNSFKDLLLRTAKGELRNRELTEGSITVTNMGDLGSHEVFGIIFPPQVAIIGLGRIHKVPVIDGSNIRPGLVMNITLSADHRVTDGLTGAKFLANIEKHLTQPDLLDV